MRKNVLKNSIFLLLLILTLFTLKGIFFAALIPIFQGSDEYIHYATVQYLAEPKEKNWIITGIARETSNTKEISKFNYTQEIREYANLTQSKNISGKPQNTQNFNPDEISRVESEMRSGKFLPYIDKLPPDIVPGAQLAHRIGSYIEKTFSEKSFFERYFSIRLLAVFYGIIVIICAYFTALWSGFKKQHALLIAAIVSFQPMLSATTAIINYDPLLIAAFSLFILGSTSILRHRLNYINIITVLGATILALLTKGTAGILIFLAAAIIAWGLRERFFILKKIGIPSIIGISTLIIALFFAFGPAQYKNTATSIFSAKGKSKTLTKSISSYLSGNLFDSGKISRTSVTYWGTFGWLDTQISGSAVKYARWVQYPSIVGILILLLYFMRNLKIFQLFASSFRKFSKKLPAKISKIAVAIKNQIWTEKDFLPAPRFIVFYILCLFALQFVVRFYDWYGTYSIGEGVGTPGRYFLPNIIPHFILVATGFGAFVKNPKTFGLILKILLSLMIFLCLYAMLLVIIPRYYL